MLKRIVLGLVVLTFAPAARAESFAGRCIGEWLPYSQAIERNAWARKCGYITAKQEVEMNWMGWIVQYDDACSSYPHVPPGGWCIRHAPVSKDAECIADLVAVGVCAIH